MKSTGLRILVVDDEPSILELVKTALEALENYEVTTALSAADALARIKDADQPFDCFLLDIQMPDVDGIELLRTIRTIPPYLDTPALMLTAMSDRKYVDDAFLEGATDYVNKPFDFLELRSRIKVAHRLVDARTKAERSLQCTIDLKNKLATSQQFGFEDPLSLDGFDRDLRYIEFDNYISQLARHKLFGSQAVALTLREAEHFFRQQGCGRFRKAIHELAACIQNATEDMECVFSYRGGGVFLIVVHGAKSPEAAQGMDNLEQLLATRIGRQIPEDRIKFLVGHPISMRILTRSGVTSALQRAVDDVRRIEADMTSVDYAPSFDVTDQDPPKGTGRKRMYERVLYELFGEESYLNVR